MKTSDAAGRVTIVDYSVGNIGSLINMLDHIDVECAVASTPEGIAAATSLILPGVGAFDAAMNELRSRGLVEPLDEAVLERRIPVLGVCLGMQLLSKGSAEGEAAGLGWIDACAEKLVVSPGSAYRVPHMGWTDVRPTRATPLFPDTRRHERFYFAHSYALRCAERATVAATISYENDVCCAVAQDNVYGVQFHPEKSHKFGMRLLANYAAFCRERCS